MKVTLLSLTVATFFSIATASAISNITALFSDGCADFCAADQNQPTGCDVNSAECWCDWSSFYYHPGCCISQLCSEDIDDVVSKLRSWCSAASVSISSNQTTPSNCSSYDYPTSTPLSFDSEDNSGGLSATAKAGIIVGVVGGISCLVIVFLSCRRVTHKEEPIQNFPLQYMQPGPRIALPPNVYMPPERVATPPPPYSAEAPEVADDKEAPLGNAFSTDSASEPSSPETSPRRVSS